MQEFCAQQGPPGSASLTSASADFKTLLQPEEMVMAGDITHSHATKQ